MIHRVDIGAAAVVCHGFCCDLQMPSDQDDAVSWFGDSPFSIETLLARASCYRCAVPWYGATYLHMTRSNHLQAVLTSSMFALYLIGSLPLTCCDSMPSRTAASILPGSVPSTMP